MLAMIVELVQESAIQQSREQQRKQTAEERPGYIYIAIEHGEH